MCLSKFFFFALLTLSRTLTVMFKIINQIKYKKKDFLFGLG